MSFKLQRCYSEKLNPAVIRGDGNKSVLFTRVRLANELRQIEGATERWKIISVIWLEIMCYAASHCRGYDHAQHLWVVNF